MYPAGILDTRITIVAPGETSDTEYGRTTGTGASYTRWAAVDWSRGTKSMREGAMDAYDSILIRMNYTPVLTRDCKIIYNDKTWRIDSMHADYKENTIQITATELES